MKTYLYIKDNVVFAYNESQNEIVGENIVEVQDSGAIYLDKRYINGEFLDKQEINYITIDTNNIAFSKNKTLFSSDLLEGKDIVVEDIDSIKIGMTWDGDKFNVTPSSVSVYPNEPGIVEELFRQREEAMQEAKNSEVLTSDE